MGECAGGGYKIDYSWVFFSKRVVTSLFLGGGGVLANLKNFFVGQNPTFCSFLQDIDLRQPFQIIYIGPNTSNLCLHTKFDYFYYQIARHKFCRTFSRICRTAGYLNQKSRSPAKSRTVGNYAVIQTYSRSSTSLSNQQEHACSKITIIIQIKELRSTSNQWSRKMFDIGGAEFFWWHIHVYICMHMPAFYVCKAQ